MAGSLHLSATYLQGGGVGIALSRLVLRLTRLGTPPATAPC